MGRGGARNRSGPPADPKSERSMLRGVSLQALPAEGYRGTIPEWPMPRQSDREAALWEWAWRTPQAAAWALPSELWRAYTVAMWVRTAARCESDDATAADRNSLHRFADQIGLTTAGLREMGWRVAVDEIAPQRAERSEDVAPSPRPRRLTVIADAQ